MFSVHYVSRLAVMNCRLRLSHSTNLDMFDFQPLGYLWGITCYTKWHLENTWIESCLLLITESLTFLGSIAQLRKATIRLVMSACLSLLVCLSICLSVWISVCLSICLSVYLFACLSACLSVCLSVYLSACLSVYLCVCLHGTTRLPLDEFSWNLIFLFLENMLRKFRFHW